MEITVGPGSPVQWGVPLPPKFNPTENERCLEVPLALAIAVWSPLVLDAGCALNIPNLHQWTPSTYVHVTLGQERVYSHRRRQYVVADLRTLPFPDRAFPCVLCISTLEHVGMDNRHYGHSAEAAPDSVWRAVSELRRVCKGALVISVPYGRPEAHPGGKWRAFGSEDIERIGQMLQPATVRVCCYARETDGWRVADRTIGGARAWRDDKTVTGLAVIRASCGA